ncbi:hypothetical protein OBBRIDRAFT_832197 [Obba rivulosa]|uniref:Uncharacterized protein n=1 Tax=Obba rivulosa TaxID=1052685 RepID=A0A8E2DQU5_9APHY|nr:hypothetical protein OBBRIDRAFT_832197 [Obba rivulosa]
MFDDVLSRIGPVTILRLQLLQPALPDILCVLRAFPLVDTLLVDAATCPDVDMEDEEEFKVLPDDVWPKKSLVKVRLLSLCAPVIHYLARYPPSQLEVLEIGFLDSGTFFPTCNLINGVCHSLKELNLLGLHKTYGFDRGEISILSNAVASCTSLRKLAFHNDLENLRPSVLSVVASILSHVSGQYLEEFVLYSQLRCGKEVDKMDVIATLLAENSGIVISCPSLSSDCALIASQAILDLWRSIERTWSPCDAKILSVPHWTPALR